MFFMFPHEYSVFYSKINLRRVRTVDLTFSKVTKDQLTPW